MKTRIRWPLIYVGGLLAFVIVGGSLGVSAVSIFGTKEKRCIEQCRPKGKTGVLRSTLPPTQQGKSVLKECNCE